MFSAEEQKFWYEKLAVIQDVVPNHCLDCRRKRRAAMAIRDEHAAAIEGARAAPKDPLARLREAEARARYFAEFQNGNAELTIAAARAARKYASGEDVSAADLWEGWVQVQLGRAPKGRALLERFVEHCADKKKRALWKLAKSILASSLCGL